MDERKSVLPPGCSESWIYQDLQMMVPTCWNGNDNCVASSIIGLSKGDRGSSKNQDDGSINTAMEAAGIMSYEFALELSAVLLNNCIMRNAATIPNRSPDPNQSRFSYQNSFRPELLRPKKLFAAIFAAWAVGMLLTWDLWILLINVTLELRWANLVVLLLPLITLSVYGCYVLGKVNSQSTKQAWWGALTAILVGYPFVYFLLSPVLHALIVGVLSPVVWLVQQDMLALDRVAGAIGFINSVRFSGSFFSIWHYSTIIAILEMVTDNALRAGRLRRLAASVLSTILLLIGVEVVAAYTSGLMNLSENEMYVMDLIKTVLYGPVIWGVVVIAVNSEYWHMGADPKN